MKRENYINGSFYVNLAVKGMMGNFVLISLKINLDAFIFKW